MLDPPDPATRLVNYTVGRFLLSVDLSSNNSAGDLIKSFRTVGPSPQPSDLFVRDRLI